MMTERMGAWLDDPEVRRSIVQAAGSLRRAGGLATKREPATRIGRTRRMRRAIRDAAFSVTRAGAAAREAERRRERSRRRRRIVALLAAAAAVAAGAVLARRRTSATPGEETEAAAEPPPMPFEPASTGMGAP